MAKVVTDNLNYTNIANAIREKTGKSEKLLPAQMADEIKTISGGGGGNNSCVVGVDDPSSVTINNYTYFPKSLIKSIDISGVKITATNYRDFFKYDRNLQEIKGLESLNTSKVTDMNSMFYECRKLTSLDLTSFDFSSVGGTSLNYDNLGYFLKDCQSLTEVIFPEEFYPNKSNKTYCSAISFFQGCSSLTSLDLSKWNTSGISDMTRMFDSCGNLKELNLSNWNTEKVTDMQGMFSSCSSLTSLDLSSFSTGNVVNMSDMFSYMGSPTITIGSNWDTSFCGDMSCMFRYSDINTYDMNIQNWNTIDVTSMWSMFEGANWNTFEGFGNGNNGVISLSWDTSNVGNMNRMFAGTYYMSNTNYLDLSTWNTSNVYDMGEMFGGPTDYNSDHIVGITLGTDWASNSSVSEVSFQCFPYLTYESSVDILNKLATRYESPTVTFNSKVYNQLSESDIAIATSKGWSVASY